MFSFFDPTSPGLVLTRRRIVRFGVGLLILVLVAAAAVPAYRLSKRWRARSLARQAQELLQQKQWPEAAQKAQAALALRRQEPLALRALARIQSQAGQPMALQVWQALISTGGSTPADRREYIETAIRLGFIDIAYREVQALLVREPNAAPNLWLLSQVCLATGDAAGSLDFAKAALQQDSTNQQYRLFTSSLLFDSSDESARGDAQKTLWQIAESPSLMGLEGLRFLARRSDLSPDNLRHVADLLRAHPLAGSPEKLLALDLTLRAQPDRSAEVLNAAIKQYQTEPLDALQQFAAWLNERRDFETSLLALPLARALERKDSLIIHLDALAGLNRWEEVERVLKSRKHPLPEVVAEAFLARSAMKLENPSAAESHWKRAFRAGEQTPDELWFLAQYAEKCGEFGQAEGAYRALIPSLQNPRAAYQGLLRLAERKSDTAQLRDLLSEMLQRWPQDRSLRNDFAYLSLLIGKDTDQAFKTANELVSTYSGSLPHRTTLALAYYRDNDFHAALNVYGGQNYDWQLALPGNRAVYVAILQANGRFNEAQTILRNLPRTALRKEELQLLDGG